MRPFIKWPGGKEHELKYILRAKPSCISNYVEPFLGGGAVFLALKDEDVSGHYIVNDLSDELISSYRYIKENNKEFLAELEVINKNNKAMASIVVQHNVRIKTLCDTTWKIFQETLQKKLEKNEISVTETDIEAKNIQTDIIFKDDAEKRKKLVKSIQKEIKNNINDEINTFLVEIADSLVLVGNINRDIETFHNNISSMLVRRLNRMFELNDGSKDEMDVSISDIFECIFKSSLYIHIRNQYNHRHNDDNPYTEAEVSAMYLYIRENCYSAMHRNNELGEFNVPYGGISYNRHDLGRKIEALQAENLHRRLDKSEFFNLDFVDFLKEISIDTSSKDFWFIDPPYDSAFSEYAQNSFGPKEHERLADMLANTKANVMIVIKNTEFIYNLYSKYKKFNIGYFSKKYGVNFANRNERQVEHLIITNYVVDTVNKET